MPRSRPWTVVVEGGEDDGEDGYEEVERQALDFLRDAMNGITSDGIRAAEAALYHVREMRGV